MPRVATLSITRDDIIKAAMRKLDILGEGETPSAEDLINFTFGLNLMLKAWEKDGYYLWKVAELAVPLLINVNTYQIGATATGAGAVVAARPMRLMDTCYVRNSAAIDRPIIIISRQEYNNLSNKATLGLVNQIYYDPQLTNGVLHVYATPTDSLSTLYITAQFPVYDFTTGTDTLDFPQEGYQAVVYGLADEMMDEYPRPNNITAQRIMQKAELYKGQLADWSQEEADLFFIPSSIR